MKMSTKGRYALRVMIDLAEHTTQEFTPMKDVASRWGLSLKYIEKLLPTLVSEKLIEGVHGKGGGYRLTRKPEEYSIGEILRLTEGDLAPVICLSEDESSCRMFGSCKTYKMWEGLNKTVNNYLDSIKLSDLL